METLLEIGLKMIDNLKGLSNLEAILMFFTLAVLSIGTYTARFFVKYFKTNEAEKKVCNANTLAIYKEYSGKMEMFIGKFSDSMNANTNASNTMNENLKLNNELIKTLTSSVNQSMIINSINK